MQNSKKSHILLAEDDENHVFIIRKAFEAVCQFECQLYVCCDGEEVLEFLQQKERPPLNLILLDVKLPKQDGFALLEFIRQQPHLQQIPVIILSSSSRMEDINRCYELGCNSYLVKPMNYQGFKEVIRFVKKFWLKCPSGYNGSSSNRVTPR